MEGRRVSGEERGIDIEVGEEEGRIGDEVRKVGDEEGRPGGEERSPGGERRSPGGDESEAEGGERSQEIVIERAGEDVKTAGRSWADIVGSQNLSQGAVPLPHARFGAGGARPNSVVLHTQAFKDITVREVMDAVLKCVGQDTIKCMQQVRGHRYFKISRFICGVNELLLKNLICPR
jgi:hypothetical protein